MSAPEVLIELLRRGVRVAAEGGTLCLKPRRVLDDALLARVREAKPAILEFLRHRPETCSPECYEVEFGVWIHRPWAVCASSPPKAEERCKALATCWHCQGEKKCGCSACWRGGSSNCTVCKGLGHLAEWLQ